MIVLDLIENLSFYFRPQDKPERLYQRWGGRESSQPIQCGLLNSCVTCRSEDTRVLLCSCAFWVHPSSLFPGWLKIPRDPHANPLNFQWGRTASLRKYLITCALQSKVDFAVLNIYINKAFRLVARVLRSSTQERCVIVMLMLYNILLPLLMRIKL